MGSLIRVVLLLVAARPPLAAAQDGVAPEAGTDLTVTLVTIGAGPLVFERFGHNMLWVRQAGTPLDSIWDWGRFSFATERFFVRFVQGDLRYWMQGDAAPRQLNSYASTGRSVLLQELALSPAQRVQLLALLRHNDTDANRFYQYHYYNDNCSTRIRDALDQVLAGRLRSRTDTAQTPWTYRDATQRLNQHNPLIHFGLTTLLADPADHRMTAWEEMFLPSGLERWVREIHVPGPEGGARSLVAGESVLARGGLYPVPDAPARWWPGYLGVGGLVLLVLAGSGRSPRRWRSVFLPAAFLYLFVAGLLGATMLFLWGFSGHQVAWRNENVFQFNLVALALLPLLPAAARGAGPRAELAGRMAVAIAALSLMGVVAKLLPGFDQANWEIIAFAVPANLGLLLGIRSRSVGAGAG